MGILQSTVVMSKNQLGMFFLSYLLIGLGGFQSNIVQLGIDQLPDATTTEMLHGMLSWHKFVLVNVYTAQLHAGSVFFFFFLEVKNCA